MQSCTDEGHIVGSENRNAEGGMTLVWGTWEMWCDIPTQSPPHLIGRSSTTGADQFHGRTTPVNWLDKVRTLGLLDSAEGFWGIYNCTCLPSQLPPNGSYYLFRKNIAPMWEHGANLSGGKWVIPFSLTEEDASAVEAGRSTDEAEQPIDIAWQRLCLCAIGELMPGREEEICGVSVSRMKMRPVAPNAYPQQQIRGEWKLSVWTRCAKEEEAQTAIGSFIAEQLRDALRELWRGSSKHSRKGFPDQIVYVGHRQLMEARQKHAKGSYGAATSVGLYSCDCTI